MAEDQEDDGLDLGTIVPEEAMNNPMYCDSVKYRQWETDIAEPIIKAAGFEILGCRTTDGDSFGPLVRAVTLRKDGVDKDYFYG